MPFDGVSNRPRRVEQRQYPRRAGTVRCWLSDGAVDRYAMLVDVSVGGARVATVAPPAVGAAVTLRFRLGQRGAQEVQALARIVWRNAAARGRGGVVGMIFSEVQGAEHIARFVGEPARVTP